MIAPHWLIDIVLGFNKFVILYFLILNTIYLCFFLLSLNIVRRFARRMTGPLQTGAWTLTGLWVMVARLAVVLSRDSRANGVSPR